MEKRQVPSESAGVVIVAAGRGSRMGTQESKQFLLLEDKPIIVHTLSVFDRHPLIQEIVLVTGAQDVERCKTWITQYSFTKPIKVIPGGAERQHSVYQGLAELSASWVLVHDGVRPFVTSKEITSCYKAAVEHGASVLAVPLKDTVKQVNPEGYVTATPDRRSLWAIQTPQVFRRSELLLAHEQAEAEGFMGTDDASLVERMGIAVKVVEGGYHNIKITTPEDLAIAESILGQMSQLKEGEDAS